jgi:hypothetical protein
MRPVFFLALLLACTCNAAPSKDLWDFWQTHDVNSTQTVQNIAWTQFLRQYVHENKQGVNLVAYSKVGQTGKAKLAKYLTYLQGINIHLYNTEQQEAYWINLYNAETVELILQHFPVKSILDINISPGWFARGPWDAKVLTIEGQKISLNDIEHRILRPIWHDNRIHYALNCASYSCPNLQRQAYAAKKLNAMLDKAAEAYVNSYRGAHFENGSLMLSKIYDWYQVDFGGNEKGVIQHLALYAKPALKLKLAKIVSVSGYNYNWNLNGE